MAATTDTDCLPSDELEKQLSPILSPPPTDFPYQESQEQVDRSREDFEPTLNDTTTSLPKTLVGGRREAEAARPSLAASKFATEVSKPTTQEPTILVPRRRSTGGRKLAKRHSPPETSQTAWSSDSSSTSSEDLQSAPSKPDHNDLSWQELNKSRRRPKRPSQNGRHGTFSGGNDQFQTRGKVSRNDGRLHISVNETANSGYLAKALGATIQHHLHPQHEHVEEAEPAKDQIEESSGHRANVPALNIVIMVIGSRGDIQPFLKIGKILKEKHGHRVRIATHPTFKNFVEKDIGLEFFSVGGDPSELMAFMVKNPGLIPSMETVRAGEIGRRRDSMYEMFQGFWRACINATDDERDTANLKMMGGKYPFVADAIIANPPSFAHYHCAEKLGIPLHLVFTFPYTPTQSFPHPLANVKSTNVDQSYTNFMSYPLVELMTWQGLGDLVNKFRAKTLGLEPVSTLWAPGQLSRLKVPFTYLWSPGLVPKPEDWGPEIDIAGYVFLDLASSFKPPKELETFLEKRDQPIVYIGFGSISGIDDPAAFTRLIFDSVEKVGVKAVVSKGWGGMGDGMDIPDSIHMVDNVPHDWLFPKMDAVIHHGGAGTTAIGLKCGKSTMIVPFFGDQPFWSAMIVRAGVGAKRSLGLKKLDVEKFAQGITECLEDEAKEAAQGIAKSIATEGDGAENMVDSFHRSLPLEGSHNMRCAIFPDRVATWTVKHTDIQLSSLAGDILVESKHLRWKDLLLKKNYEWHDFQGPGEPITGASGAFMSSLHEAVHGISNIPKHTKKDMRKRDRRKRKQQRKTVADAITVPGQIASAARISDKRGHIEDGEIEKVNMTGEAEPRKKLPRVRPGIDPKRPVQSDGQARGDLPRTTTGGDVAPVSSKPVTVMKDTAEGVGFTGKALIKMPVEVLYAMALGFRNAPRLYGDSTVRPPPDTIDGFRSGVRAAGSEFVLGFYDGVTGLVRIPYEDVKEEGKLAFATGFGKGVGGLVLKPISGMIGVWAYTGKGIEASLRKRLRDTAKTERWIRRARMNQGAKDVREYLDSVGHDTSKANGNGLQEIKTQTLEQWTSKEQQLVRQAREKDQKSLLPAPPRRRYWRNKAKVAAASGQT